MPFSNQELAHHIWQAVRILVFAAFVTVILSAGNVYLTVHRSRTLEEIQKQTNIVQGQVNELKKFVDEVRESNGDSQNNQNSQAISDAVNKLIPQIRDILCEAYPVQCARTSKP